MTAGGALLLDESCEGPHMATPNTMRAITAPIAICVRRGFNERAGTDSSPIARFAVVSKYPAGRGSHAAAGRSDGSLRRAGRAHPPWPGCLGLPHLPSTA